MESPARSEPITEARFTSTIEISGVKYSFQINDPGAKEPGEGC
jgi:hypothetical protein